MARRIQLPRLTHRQRSARWQRERRQQAVIVTVFTAILLSAMGLVVWAASERYYTENISPAFRIDGRMVPMREFERRLDLELVKFYYDYDIPAGFEDDPNLLQQKAIVEEIALNRLIEEKLLDAEAREVGYTPSAQEIESQYAVQFGEVKVRHILIGFDDTAEDKALDELNAAARARAIRNQLAAAPMDDELWKQLAAQHSTDEGSKFSGGDLGFASSGTYVAEFEEAIRTLAIGQVSDPVRSQFGFHILQVQERRAPTEHELTKRYLAAGFSEADLKEQARYGVLRNEFEARAKVGATTSPTEQVHVAGILINIPRPTGQNFTQFTDALQKQTDVRTALDEGKDFGEVAKEFSDDSSTRDKGGDMAWIAKGMLVDPTTEERIFATEVGKVSEPVSLGDQWAIYKVLAKEPSRELDADQRRDIEARAYDYWLERERLAHEVLPYILGF